MISIAICDDEAVFAEALHALVDAGMKEILYGENSMDERELSYEITVFTNPLMMIDALKTKRFDLAFLDLLMNKESGFGVAQEIRRMRLNTEIAIVTSYGEARNDAFQYRPIGYVDKPATIEEVTRLLRLYIDFYSDCRRYIYVGKASEERRIAALPPKCWVMLSFYVQGCRLLRMKTLYMYRLSSWRHILWQSYSCTREGLRCDC